MEQSATELLLKIAAGIDELKTKVQALAEEQPEKDLYTTAEVARAIGRAEYTIREHCRQGRIRATKKPCGRGKGGEWLIHREELRRLRNEGLLPVKYT